MIDGVPENYSECFATYLPFVRQLVRGMGISEHDDVAQEIMLRFQERDFLPLYDPTKTGHGKKTNFRAFLRGFAVPYAMGMRDTETKRKRREPVMCDKPIGDGGQVYFEVVQTPAEQDTTGLEESERIVLMRSCIGEMPNRGRREYLRLFDLMLPMIKEFGELDRKELGRKFGVSASVIGSMIGEIRDQLSWMTEAAGSRPTVVSV